MATEIPDTQPSTQLQEKLAHQLPCQKCLVLTSLDAGAVPKGTGLQCKSCWNLYQILYRHLGGLPESLTQMEPEKQKEFFKTTGEKVLSTPKNGRWALVRKSVATSVASFRTEQVTMSVEKKLLPLSVWAKDGFDIKDIEARGESRDDDATLFAFDLYVFLLASGVSAYYKYLEIKDVAVCPLCFLFVSASYINAWCSGLWKGMDSSFDLDQDRRHRGHRQQGIDGERAQAQEPEKTQQAPQA